MACTVSGDYVESLFAYAGCCEGACNISIPSCVNATAVDHACDHSAFGRMTQLCARMRDDATLTAEFCDAYHSSKLEASVECLGMQSSLLCDSACEASEDLAQSVPFATLPPGSSLSSGDTGLGFRLPDDVEANALLEDGTMVRSSGPAWTYLVCTCDDASTSRSRCSPYSIRWGGRLRMGCRVRACPSCHGILVGDGSAQASILIVNAQPPSVALNVSGEERPLTHKDEWNALNHSNAAEAVVDRLVERLPVAPDVDMVWSPFVVAGGKAMLHLPRAALPLGAMYVLGPQAPVVRCFGKCYPDASSRVPHFCTTRRLWRWRSCGGCNMGCIMAIESDRPGGMLT